MTPIGTNGLKNSELVMLMKITITHLSTYLKKIIIISSLFKFIIIKKKSLC